MKKGANLQSQFEKAKMPEVQVFIEESGELKTSPSKLGKRQLLLSNLTIHADPKLLQMESLDQAGAGTEDPKKPKYINGVLNIPKKFKKVDSEDEYADSKSMEQFVERFSNAQKI